MVPRPHNLAEKKSPLIYPAAQGPMVPACPQGAECPLSLRVAESRAAREGLWANIGHTHWRPQLSPLRRTPKTEQPTVREEGMGGVSTHFPCQAHLVAGNSTRRQIPPGWARS